MLEPFDYLVPSSIEDAISMLSMDGTKAIMGGTDLVVQITEHRIMPKALVDLAAIPGLDGLSVKRGKITIGAAVTHARLAEWAEKEKPYYALYEASGAVGTPQVRNLATVVGNLCNAVPSADLAAPLLVLDTNVRIAGADGIRNIPLNAFFTGPKKTVLKKNEIVTEISISSLPVCSVSRYYKLGPRNASDLAIVGVACAMSVDGQGRLVRLQFGLSAVGPTPLLVDGSAWIGQAPDETVAWACAKMCAQACSPITDARAGADYRRDMVEYHAYRAVIDCAKMLLEESV